MSIELQETINQLTEGFVKFKQENEERFCAIEQRSREEELRLARPGFFGKAADDVHANQDAPGFTVLTKQTLTNPELLAERLGVNEAKTDGNPAPKMGEFLRAVSGGTAPEHVKSLVEGTDASGGYAVPEVMLPGILTALVPASSLLSAGANIVRVDSGGGKSFTVAGISSIPTPGWRNENGQVAESDPAFSGLTITPRSLAFMFKISRELLQDGPGVEGALNTVIAQAFAKEMDRAGLRGSGTAPEIRGLLNTVGVHEIELGTGDGAVLANYAPFINAAYEIKSVDAPAPNAAIMAPRSEKSIALFQDTTEQPLRRPDALANWSFHTTSQIPTNLTVGASTDCSEIYVGDFSRFSFYLREGLSVQVVKELYAGTGQIAFIAHARLDVAVMYPKAFTVLTGVRG